MDINIPRQTQYIPRVCLCGAARSGTSMMMRVLQAGGLTVDIERKCLDPFTMKMMREPYGMMENFTMVQAGQFVNSFKLIDSTKFPLVPTDYNFIFINRPFAEITKSWQAIATIYNTLHCATFPLAAKLAEAQKRVNDWQAVLDANTGTFLVLDYDTVCSNPQDMSASVANWIDTSVFSFDQVAAAAAVDTQLYINRSI